MPIPQIGSTVIVRGIQSNGATEHPAIITRAWSTQDTDRGAVAVNLTVLPDCGAPLLRTSVMLFSAEHQALEYCGGKNNAVAAYWPAKP